MTGDDEHGRAPLPTEAHPHRDPETGVLVWCEQDPVSGAVTWIWADPVTGERTEVVDPDSVPFDATPSPRGRKPPSLVGARERIFQEAIIRREASRLGVLNAARVAGDIASPHYLAPNGDVPETAEARAGRARKHREWSRSRSGKKALERAAELARHRHYEGRRERPTPIAEPLWRSVEKVYGLALIAWAGAPLYDVLAAALDTLAAEERAAAEAHPERVVSMVGDLLRCVHGNAVEGSEARRPGAATEPGDNRAG